MCLTQADDLLVFSSGNDFSRSFSLLCWWSRASTAAAARAFAFSGRRRGIRMISLRHCRLATKHIGCDFTNMTALTSVRGFVGFRRGPLRVSLGLNYLWFDDWLGRRWTFYVFQTGGLFNDIFDDAALLGVALT